MSKEKDSKDGDLTTKDFVSGWKDKRNSRRKVGLGMSVRTLILVLVLLLICLLWLESKIN